MPQMAPMNWLMLYMFFSVIFILFNFMNYYMFLTLKHLSSSKNLSKKFYSWKW
uniref:ATP synthase complex subunit 8 n=1 Tax=Nectoporus subrotundus TaxID=2811606 RepID=A0A894JSM6_9DYTI|nr:ATP synthase F0 subunit 8 [Nectoporus subrotundus]QRV62793.1 ATP synthase F0 subunit 8 [Nectoporus subrotundus]